MNALALSSRVSTHQGEGQRKDQGLRINHNGLGVAGAIADPGTAFVAGSTKRPGKRSGVE